METLFPNYLSLSSVLPFLVTYLTLNKTHVISLHFTYKAWPVKITSLTWNIRFHMYFIMWNFISLVMNLHNSIFYMWNVKFIFKTWIWHCAFFFFVILQLFFRTWNVQLFMAKYPFRNLEMEDAGVVLSEALIRGNHSVQQLLVHCQTGDGSQQPAVTCQQQDSWAMKTLDPSTS